MTGSVKAATGVMACELGEGMALLHHGSGTFFILDEIGSLLWKRIATPTMTTELASTVLDAYEVERDEVERDVARLIADMIDAQLVVFESHSQ